MMNVISTLQSEYLHLYINGICSNQPYTRGKKDLKEGNNRII